MNNCEFQPSDSCDFFIYDHEEIRGETLENVDSFCRRDSANNLLKITDPHQTDETSFHGIIAQIGLGILIIAIGFVFILASKVRKKIREAKHEARLEGRTFHWGSEIWNSIKKVSSEAGKKTASALKAVGRLFMPWKWKIFRRPETPQLEKATENVMFYPTAVKPNETAVAEQFRRFLRSGNRILMRTYAGMAITKWKGKTEEQQREYWERDMQHEKGLGRKVGSLPFSFVKEFVQIDIQRMNTILGDDPDALASQLRSDPEVAASGIDVEHDVKILQQVKGALLEHYVTYPPSEDMVSKQITANYRSISVSGEPALVSYIVRSLIGEWLSIKPENRINYVDKISTIPEPGGLPIAFIRRIMKRLNLQNPHRRADLVDFAPVFHQIAALDLGLNGAKFKKIREIANVVYASWNLIDSSITRIFGARKKWGGLPDQFIRLARASVEAIAQTPVIYIKEEPWSVRNKDGREIYEGINVAHVKRVAIEKIPKLDEYSHVLNMLALRIVDDWNAASEEIRKAFIKRDAEAFPAVETVNEHLPRPFILLWLMVNGGLSVMSEIDDAPTDTDDDDDPEDPNGNGTPVDGNDFSETNGGQMGSPDSSGGSTSAMGNNQNMMPQGAAMAAGGPAIPATLPPQQTMFFGSVILSPIMFSPAAVLPVF